MATRYEIRPATYNDTTSLQELINNTSQQGSVTINFERYPDFFHGSHVTTTDSDIWVMLDTQEKCLAGVFSIGSREVYVNGERKRIRYGNDLRIHPDYQGGYALFRLFKKYQEMMKNEWMQTVILSENESSLATEGSGREGLPNYYEYGELKTNMVYLSRPQKKKQKETIESGVHIRRAKETDIDTMQAFADKEAQKRQFYPHYDFSAVNQNNPYYKDLELSDYFLAFKGARLVGITGIWDQKGFNNPRFLSYSGGVQALRHVNNWRERLLKGMNLPEAGDVLEYLVLHCILIENNNIDVFRALFSEIYNMFSSNNCLGRPRKGDKQKYKALVCGLSADDSLNEVMDGYRKQVLSSRHFIASYSGDPREKFDPNRQLYLEAARL